MAIFHSYVSLAEGKRDEPPSIMHLQRGMLFQGFKILSAPLGN